MIDASDFVDELVRGGIRYLTGVPCSFLTPLINESIARQDTRYLIASSEGDALSIASGLWLGGKSAAVMCQNSGLGNMVNPLTSLNDTFQIPTLLLVTWRGTPGEKDEPQHALMGQITPDLLTLLGIPWQVLPKEPQEALALLRSTLQAIATTEKTRALVIEGGTFTACGAPSDRDLPGASERLPSRAEALSAIVVNTPADAVLVATTGKTGRELFTLDDRSRNFYCVGSMGYASAIAHGLSLATDQPVYVLDGDGAAIMHLGNLTSIGISGRRNFTHIVIDNQTYDSTGGQKSAAFNVDFCAIAMACGYRGATRCHSIGELQAALKQGHEGPHLIHVPVNCGAMENLGRPTMPPPVVARRLKENLV
ncbi:phosphonopyruvate decarboxylase [Pseudomonas sp. N3-W]|uniref:phosphonopyruvate decarboxylase n=1 Tax=Pseudomonas sp. N3-W TaxID=2975049 RepID=UPI00217D3B8E|nr:phosphonopyruvate decarboxylase [Pseudomonas sp. N3-W]UWF47034.1 phosphonopyruvate decarboxylase [Pseudomonas sp. N3-W]